MKQQREETAQERAKRFQTDTANVTAVQLHIVAEVVAAFAVVHLPLQPVKIIQKGMT